MSLGFFFWCSLEHILCARFPLRVLSLTSQQQGLPTIVGSAVQGVDARLSAIPSTSVGSRTSPPGPVPPGHLPPGHVPPGHLPQGHIPPKHIRLAQTFETERKKLLLYN